ncbi:hypothetical protein ACNAWD_22230 [Rhodococcus erythropolis]|uniref:hypothetical protein n=1 Tax=Rhodococcus TaxID=1827 RepID=UPI0038D4E47A
MEAFQIPTDEQVKEVLRKIPTLQLRRAFFEKLRNTEWVEPLAKEGAFKNPPEPEQAEDGLIRDVYWPEIGYLMRVAPEEPEAVVKVLLTFGATKNAWVKRGVFSIGASLPAYQAARLEPLIRKWQPSGFGWRTDPRDLIAFAVNLIQGEQYAVGKWFAALIFKPSKVRGRREVSFVIEDYWYEQGLPELVEVLEDDGLELVLPWLIAYERRIGHLRKGRDVTYISRESLRSRGGIHDGVEQVLIDAVRDLAIKAMSIDASGAKLVLLNSNMILARKIALFSLSEAIRQVGNIEHLQGNLLAAGRELLFDEKSSDDSCRIDYAELARAVADVSPESLEPLTQFIEIGPRDDDDHLREWIGKDGADDAVIDERIREYEDRWKHQWLSAIGVGALPAQLQTKLSELDSNFGVIEAPREPTMRITTWTGPNSPIDQDEMAAMTPSELVSHLESWHDKGDGWGPAPSHEGQGRALTALTATNPKAVAGAGNLVERLRPVYLRAVLRGWEAALKADLQPDWAQVIELIAGVLEHDIESSFPREGARGDDDDDFRWAKQAAVGLLEEVVKGRASLTVPDKVMAKFAELLISSAADEMAWDEYIRSGVDSGMDPLTISLNWQWPIRIRGLIYLMTHGKDTEWYDAARSALETELVRVDLRGASRAVIGEGLGRLLSVDREWLTPRIADLFGSDTGLSVEQQIALTTAMAVHHYHSTLFELLGPAMIGAIRSEDPLVVGWQTQSDPLQRIGEWVISSIIHGHLSTDDPVASEFLSVVPAKVRGDAFGQIAWAFMHAETVDDQIRDRFADLWDTRVEHVRNHSEDQDELSGFQWFVKSNKFATEWWLPRLKEAAALNPHLNTERYTIGKELAASSGIDPRQAFEVLKLLLEGRDEADLVAYDLTLNAVPAVIARAIASGDDGLKHDAYSYMNALGEKGHLSLASDVREILDLGLSNSDANE